jgi:hypothetical protein
VKDNVTAAILPSFRMRDDIEEVVDVAFGAVIDAPVVVGQ